MLSCTALRAILLWSPCSSSEPFFMLVIVRVVEWMYTKPGGHLVSLLALWVLSIKVVVFTSTENTNRVHGSCWTCGDYTSEARIQQGRVLRTVCFLLRNFGQERYLVQDVQQEGDIQTKPTNHSNKNYFQVQKLLFRSYVWGFGSILAGACIYDDSSTRYKFMLVEISKDDCYENMKNRTLDMWCASQFFFLYDRTCQM